jgi:co-chaperonin GroES (HSP10)
MELKTVFNKIIVEIIEEKSAIVVSDDIVKGKVLATGEGTQDFPMSVEIGTIVYFNKRDAMPLAVELKTYYILSQLNILAYE